jgi:alpha-L-fucosidase
MDSNRITRRNWITTTAGSLAGMAVAPGLAAAAPNAAAQTQTTAVSPQESADAIVDRERRMRWWHDARFGMFIHWGLYSTIGRHEWVMENEGWPVADYEQHAKIFKPVPNAAQAWAKLAKAAGQKYMVMTTKHHEGFCNFDASKYTNYCAPKQGPGRDLVEEYVAAARAEGMHVGFYYSLMDWHHPDGAICATDEDARKRFVEYTHGLIRELMTNYGKIDVLWYDVSWPLTPEQWESERMNKMVFQLQPDVIVNNRNGLPGDFQTPEQQITADKNGRAWESCMTLNDSWGYQRADDDWKSARRVVQNLITCAKDTGNYLLNIGPKADGTIPQESVTSLTEVGGWLSRNGESIHGSEPCQPARSNYASFTRKANTLYMHVYFWPGDYVAIAGLQCQVKSARMLASGHEVKFDQDKFRVRFTGLPTAPPDHPVTTIAIECDQVPTQDNIFVRRDRPRGGVGMS